MANITVREFLTEEEIEISKVNNEQMLYESFKFDGLVDESVLAAIEKVYGEDGLERVSRKFAADEFQRTLDMSLDGWIDYYGDNDPVVEEKLEKIRLASIKAAHAFAKEYEELVKTTVPVRRVWIVAG